MIKQATMNRLWSKLILDALYRQGVRYFCLAPGSRSTPLTLEAAQLAEQKNDVQLHSHFDERGLGFFALGLAKTTEHAVAIIVTSGTAVANLLPAVVESGLTREKLILLTADRPQQLIQCGANQAIVQQGIFSSHVTSCCNLPSPCAQIPAKWVLAEISQILSIQQQSQGSIHINCPFAEPLYGGFEQSEQSAIEVYLNPVHSYLQTNKPYLPFVDKRVPNFQQYVADWQRLQAQKGVIILGNVKQRDKTAITALCAKLGWPLLADPQAGIATPYSGFDLWLQNDVCQAKLEQCQFILQFGARLVSKRLGQFLASFSGDYWLVDEHFARLDPHHLMATRMQFSAFELIANIIEYSSYNPWAKQLITASRNVLALASGFSQKAYLSELAIAKSFRHWRAKDSILFIGNSMAVRLLDMVGDMPDGQVFTNRGASGIDGLIATAAGAQRGCERAMLCLLGDISSLYDLNSLALLAQCQHPFVLVIINNDGCGIFDLLPVPEKQKKGLYQMPHQCNFYHAANMFGLNYHAPTSLNQARNLCLEAQTQPVATLIELIVPAAEASADLEALFDAVAVANLISC